MSSFPKLFFANEVGIGKTLKNTGAAVYKENLSTFSHILETTNVPWTFFWTFTNIAREWKPILLSNALERFHIRGRPLAQITSTKSGDKKKQQYPLIFYVNSCYLRTLTNELHGAPLSTLTNYNSCFSPISKTVITYWQKKRASHIARRTTRISCHCIFTYIHFIHCEGCGSIFQSLIV